MSELSDLRRRLEALEAAEITMTDWYTEVARGNVAGTGGFTIPGRKDGVGTTVLEDITQTGNTVMPRPAGADIEIVSSSGSDISAGTGAQTIEIEYLDVNGDEASVTKTMNGTTAVNIGTAVYDVQWMHSATAGTGGVAAGNIQIRDVATGAIIYEQISAGGNQSLTARYKIPNGKTGYITTWPASAVPAIESWLWRWRASAPRNRSTAADPTPLVCRRARQVPRGTLQAETKAYQRPFN